MESVFTSSQRGAYSIDNYRGCLKGSRKRVLPALETESVAVLCSFYGRVQLP